MKSIHFRLLVAGLAVLLGTSLAQSQTPEDAPPAHTHRMAMRGHMIGFFAKQLNLTDDQKAQMKAIMQKEHPTMKPLFEQQHQIDTGKFVLLLARVREEVRDDVVQPF